MNIETALDLIKALGWRLHTLSSYPGVTDSRLLWGASIRVSSMIYGHSINQSSPEHALERAIEHARERVAFEYQVFKRSHLAASRSLPTTLDSIFE